MPIRSKRLYACRLDSLLRLEDRCNPATITVTNLNDAGPGSLRNAIAQANNESVNPGPDTIVFAPTIRGGTIGLASFSNPSTSTATVPQPVGPTAFIVTSKLTISGTGEALNRFASGPEFRFFQVTGSGNLTLINLSLANGVARGTSGGGGGGAAGLGGAIYNQGVLSIFGSTLTLNQAIGGGLTVPIKVGGAGLGWSAIAGDDTPGAGNGGGPNGGLAFGGGGGNNGQPNGGSGGFGGGGGTGYNGGNGGFGGGGAYGRNLGGSGGFGGGYGGNNRPEGSPGATLGQAGSGLGGALFNQGGVVLVANSTIEFNSAIGGDAPAAFPGDSGSAAGGGIFNLNGELTLINVTIAGNNIKAGSTTFPGQVAGGIDGGQLASGSYDVGSATATQVAKVTAANSIFGHSGSGSAVAIHRNVGSSSFNATGPNIVDGKFVNSGGSTFSGTAVTNANPQLGMPKFNGGFTPTMVPQAGSPAIDAGDNAAIDSVTIDQRGGDFVRVFNGTVDIGAVEVQPQPPIVYAAVSGPTNGFINTLASVNGQFSFNNPINTSPGSSTNVRTAVADVTGDGIPDFIIGAGPGDAAKVTVINGLSFATVVSFFAFEQSFKGGIFVGAADIDGDGKAEVVVAPDESGGPIAAIYRGSQLAAGIGGQNAQLTRFFGIADPNFRGGMRPALADINGDGAADLVVSAGLGGGPRIAMFDGQSLKTGTGNPNRFRGDFFAFEGTLRNGAFVAAGDINGDGKADIVFGGGPGGGPRVRVFDGAALLSAPSFSNLDQIAGTAQLANFFAGDAGLRGGVRLALHDGDVDGKADMLTGSGSGEPSKVRVYRATNLLGSTNPTADQILMPFNGDVLANGVFVG